MMRAAQARAGLVVYLVWLNWEARDYLKLPLHANAKPKGT